MREYIKFLKEEPFVKRLLFIQLAVQTGAWFSQVAIFVLLIDLKVQPIIIGICSAASFLPTIILAPISGIIIEKFNPKKLMLFCIFIETLSTLLLTLIHKGDYLHILILIIIIFAKMSVASLYFTTQMSQLPKILDDQKLKLANECQSMTWSFGFTIGMAAAGIFVDHFGTTLSFIIDALFIFIAFLVLKWTYYPKELNTKERITSLFINALKYLFTNKLLMYIIFLHSCIALTTYDAIIPIMAKYHYTSVISVPLAIGFINSIRAISLIIGNSLLSKTINRYNLKYFILLQGVGIVIWGIVSNNFYFSLIGGFLAGFMTALLWAYTYTMVQLNTKKQFYSSICAYTDMFFMSISVIVSVLTGKAVEFISTSHIIMIIGSIFILYTVVLIYVQKKYNVKYS